MVGLTNVDNISDANKPVSSAQLAALNLKANCSNILQGGITKAMVGLGKQLIISDANKPVSSAQLAALNLKSTSFTIIMELAHFNLHFNKLMLMY
jgi:hypothetical protein